MKTFFARRKGSMLIAGLAVTGMVNATPMVDLWAMSNGGDGNLWTIDVGANTTTLVGQIRDPLDQSIGSGWSTVAETPNKNLYFLRRFTSDINVYRLDSTNIQVSGGIITNLVSLGATGLGGNLDGLTAGPDGNLYFTGYDNTGAGVRNDLFRFSLSSNTTEYVGTFNNNQGPGGRNSFHTDLAFDPPHRRSGRHRDR